MHGYRSGWVKNYTVLVALGLTVSSTAHAVRVETSASVTPGITITDNVCLSENDKKWDWIGVATPRGSVNVKGKKSSLTLSTSVQLNTLTDSQLEDNGCSSGLGQREKFSPRLNANLKTELIPGWLNLGVRGLIDQQEANFGRAGGEDDFDRLGNRNNYYRYSLNPTLSHRIGPYAKGTLRYSFDQKFNSVNTIADTTRQTATLSIDKTGASRLNLGISGTYTRLEADETRIRRSRTSELSSALVRGGYQFTKRLQANGSWGWDFNDFVSNSRSRRDQRGARWDAGLRWTPSARTRVSLGTGNRYFGNTPRVGIEHKRRLSTFSLDYSTRITFEREIRDLQRGFLDGFAGSSSIRGDSPIIDERVTLGYRYDGRRANINLTGSWSEQEREDDGAVSVFKNVGLTFAPVLSRRYSLSATVTWDEDEPRQPLGSTDPFFDQPTSETWRGILTVSRQLNNRFNLSLNYIYTDRQSDGGFGEYQENRLTAFLGITL